ncbi:HU family DNA-binding protein [Bacteroides acidifaciens]|uniref:HU family DNA-binding protein n=1 Tax=Bacteroides acidifaciens TaxID=85831 RepID=UPI002149AF32|nr:HU family DNA-binding protein [Bacteroides acidifaciens]MCR2007427.1 HU family DNA-binding protein [Bacteroides acidifaciens]
MSVKYSLALMSSKPGDETAQKKYYAKAQADGVVTMDEMADDIAYATSLTDGDVLNVVRALIRQMKKHLAAGKIVKMEQLGTFQVQVSSVGAEEKKDFSSANITGVSVQFRPGRMVREVVSIASLSFSRVAGKKEVTADGETPDPTPDGGGGNPDEGETPDPAA